MTQPCKKMRLYAKPHASPKPKSVNKTLVANTPAEVMDARTPAHGSTTPRLAQVIAVYQALTAVK
jgi:hypothetical protein